MVETSPPRIVARPTAQIWGLISSYLFLLPALLIFLVFVVYPIVWISVSSLYAQPRPGSTEFVGLANYVKVFKDPTFWVVMKNMFFWALITIPVQMLIGGTLAYAIEKYTNRSRTFFRTAFFLPVVTSVSVIAITWSHMYAPYYGIIQEYAKIFGIKLTNSLIADPHTAIFALIIVNVWQWTGFSMLMYVAGLNNIPTEIYDAARMDGASGFPLARWVIVPMLAPVTKSLLLLGIIGTLQTFPIVHLMTGGGPNHASEVFGSYIFTQGFKLGQTGYASTLSVVVLLLALVLTVLQIVLLGSQLTPVAKERGKA